MKRLIAYKKSIVSTILLAGGCGAVHDIVIETAKARAIQAIENAVGDAVDNAIDNAVGDLLDLDDLDLPFDDQSREDREEEVLEGDAAESDERDRETRRVFSGSNRLP